MWDDGLRINVAMMLDSEFAHVSFGRVVEDWPEALRGVVPEGLPYSAWQLVEHLRIAQWDILEYARNPKHVSPPFPGGYWPEEAAPPTAGAWDASIAAFEAERVEMIALVKDPNVDLQRPLEQDPKHSVLREALLLADHNAYHVGQLIVLRRLLGAWED